MTLATRLLIAGGGSVALPPPAPVESVSFEIRAAPEGGWPYLVAPFYNATAGKSIIPTITNTGAASVVEYNHTTGATSRTSLRALGADQHNVPAVLRRASDGKYVAVYCDHAGSALWRQISTNANDATAWDAAADLDGSVGSTNYTYPALFQLGDEANDPIYCLYRDIDGAGSNWCLTKSTDGGSTFGLLTNLTYGTRYYMRGAKSSEARLDFVVSAGSYAEDYADVYHFYYEGGNYYQTDGTQLAGSPPFTITSFTKVYEGGTAGCRSPWSIVKSGTDIAVVFPVQTGTPADHLGEDEDYIYARWNGSAWSTHTLHADVGATAFAFTEGGLDIDPSDINRVIVSIRGVGGVGEWRIWDCTTADSGATWTKTQLTSAGDRDQYPAFVSGYQAELEFVWLKGPTWNDQDDWSAAIYGYGTGG